MADRSGIPFGRFAPRLGRGGSFLLSGVFGVGVVILASYYGIDSDWLKARIVERVARSLDAQLQVDRLEFNPLTGTATLEGVDFDREGSNSTLALDVDRIELNLKIMPLFGGTLHFQKLRVFSPSAEFTTWPPTGPPPARERTAMRFEDFSIEGGSVAIAVRNSAPEPFMVSADAIDYDASGIDLGEVATPIELFYGADLETVLNVDGEVPLEKEYTKEKTTISLRDIDMSYLDRHFGRGKPFRVVGGSLDVQGELDEGRVVQRLTLRDIELEPAPDGAWETSGAFQPEVDEFEAPVPGVPPADPTAGPAAGRRADSTAGPIAAVAPPTYVDPSSALHFTSVPAELSFYTDELMDYVERRDGEIELTLTSEDRSLLPGRDLHAFFRWWWLQVWKRIALDATASVHADSGATGDMMSARSDAVGPR